MADVPGSSPRNPLHVRTADGQLEWKRIVVMLALTVLTGYLASQSQRQGANADFNTVAKMRIARAGQRIGDALITTGIHLTDAATRLYESARP